MPEGLSEVFNELSPGLGTSPTQIHRRAGVHKCTSNCVIKKMLLVIFYNKKTDLVFDRD